MDASCWVNNPQVRGSKPRSAILIFIILLLLFIFVRMICLFRVSRYHLHTSIFIRVLLSLSIGFWLGVEDASDLVHKNCRFTRKWTKTSLSATIIAEIDH